MFCHPLLISLFYSARVQHVISRAVSTITPGVTETRGCEIIIAEPTSEDCHSGSVPHFPCLKEIDEELSPSEEEEALLSFKMNDHVSLKQDQLVFAVNAVVCVPILIVT